MGASKYRNISGTTFFDGTMATRGYALNKLCHSFNSQDGREAFLIDEEGCYEKYGLTEPQRQAFRDRDVLRLIQEGGSIYYLAKLGAILNLSVQDLGGLQTGRSTHEFQAYLESQSVGKDHG